MAEVDWDKVLPVLSDFWECGPVPNPDALRRLVIRQRDMDMERIKPLVKALQQILDWGTLYGALYDAKWGHTPRCDFTPTEMAYAVLRDLGVLPEGQP